jgi:hypothetical protein
LAVHSVDVMGELMEFSLVVWKAVHSVAALGVLTASESVTSKVAEWAGGWASSLEMESES